jgi:hypothetical protein
MTTQSIFCIVLACLCILLALFDYFRTPPANPPGREPLFWPLLGILIIETCRMFGAHA